MSRKDLCVDDFQKNNLNLQILTDTGWEDFSGVVARGKLLQTVTVKTTTSQIKCTLDHKVFTSKLLTKEAKQLKIGDNIIVSKGVDAVVSISLNDELQTYDIVNAGSMRRYYANNILVANCEFIINDETLIAPAVLVDLQGQQDPLFRTGQVRWYKKPEAGKIYVVALDPSLGTGSDPAAIQVFEANTTTQIAEWRHNRTAIPAQIRILADICKFINETVKDSKSIYYSIENNTIGEAALISIAEYGEEKIEGYFLSDNSVAGGARRIRKGFNTTHKSKLSACNKLKILVESKKMQINSAPLISELKTFVAHGTSYAAKPGETDDLVMGTVLAVRMMMLLQNYHTEMDSQMRDFGDSMVEPMPFFATFR